MRRRSALLALLAVLLHALAPLLANAAPGAAVDHIELCTAQGIVTVEVKSGGAPAGTQPTPGHCPDCAFHTVIAATPCIGQLPQASAWTLVPVAEQTLPRFTSLYTARPRAPPHRS